MIEAELTMQWQTLCLPFKASHHDFSLFSRTFQNRSRCHSAAGTLKKSAAVMPGSSYIRVAAYVRSYTGCSKKCSHSLNRYNFIKLLILTCK